MSGRHSCTLGCPASTLQQRACVQSEHSKSILVRKFPIAESNLERRASSAIQLFDEGQDADEEESGGGQDEASSSSKVQGTRMPPGSNLDAQDSTQLDQDAVLEIMSAQEARVSNGAVRRMDSQKDGPRTVKSGTGEHGRAKIRMTEDQISAIESASDSELKHLAANMLSEVRFCILTPAMHQLLHHCANAPLVRLSIDASLDCFFVPLTAALADLLPLSGRGIPEGYDTRLGHALNVLELAAACEFKVSFFIALWRVCC